MDENAVKRYRVVLTCEDETTHFVRGMVIEEDQISPTQLQLFLTLGSIQPVSDTTGSAANA